MPKQDLDSQINALYQLPLDQFTSARNALAKEAGKDAGDVKQLTKPPVAAWAVNQLHWQRRDDYDALIAAAQEMRRTHKAVIEGRKGDLRAASREHDRAVDQALKAAIELLKDLGQPVTEATRQAILNTLRALPSSEAPGRLSRTLSPGGFEMLAGVTPAAPAAKTGKEAKPVKEAKPQKDKAQREALERAVRDAEHHARRTEFESARASRDAAKAAKHLESARAGVERAREALESAERDVAAAEREAAAAERARETAERKARDAEAALTAARLRATHSAVT